MTEHDPTTERFIGALTVALGVGAMIPRSGFGLYQVLEQGGERMWWSLIMLSAGVWLIACSSLPMRAVRTTLLAFSVVVWIALAVKFFDATLWGAALQSVVVIAFSSLAIYRINRRQSQ